MHIVVALEVDAADLDLLGDAGLERRYGDLAAACQQDPGGHPDTSDVAVLKPDTVKTAFTEIGTELKFGLRRKLEMSRNFFGGLFYFLIGDDTELFAIGFGIDGLVALDKAREIAARFSIPGGTWVGGVSGGAMSNASGASTSSLVRRP